MRRTEHERFVRAVPPDGPTDANLHAIEHEWPLIEAELALVDAEIRVLTAEGGPTQLDWRRLRRAEHGVLRAAAMLAAGGYDVTDLAA